MTKAVARVYVNDIEVGTVPAETYKKIVEDAHADWRLRGAQLLNYGHVLYRFLAKVMVLWPVAVCLLLVLCEVFEPSAMVDEIAALRAATPAQVNGALSLNLTIGWWASFVFVGGGWIFSNRYAGLVDRFDEAISHRVRSLLEEPSQGKLMVVVESDASDDQ